jgi:regulator of protease activity HflC (stomatin/prohibitin superfamily)
VIYQPEQFLTRPGTAAAYLIAEPTFSSAMSPLIIFPIIVVLLLLSLGIAQEYQRAIVFRLGRFVGTRGPGLYYSVHRAPANH